MASADSWWCRSSVPVLFCTGVLDLLHFHQHFGIHLSGSVDSLLEFELEMHCICKSIEAELMSFDIEFSYYEHGHIIVPQTRSYYEVRVKIAKSSKQDL